MNCSSIHKEDYFVKKTPPSFETPNLLAVNSNGSFFYTFKYKIEPKILDDPPQISWSLSTCEICKCHAMSGETVQYSVDEEFDMNKVVKVLEMYVLTDNHVVFVGLQTDKEQFFQSVLKLDSESKHAFMIAERKFTVQHIIGPPFINLSTLDNGRILITGVRSSRANGMNTRMAISVKANPLSGEYDDADISEMIEDFNNFLRSAPMTQKMMAIFVLSIDTEKITLLLSLSEDEIEPKLITDQIGKIDRVKGAYSIEIIDNSNIPNNDELKMAYLKNLKIRNGNVWMCITSPDYKKLGTMYWRLRLVYVRIVLKLMIGMMNGALWTSKFDKGLCITAVMMIFRTIYGPGMIPVYSPVKQYSLYYLNMSNNKFVKIEHTPRVKSTINPANADCFATNFEVDKNGGILVLDEPTEALKMHKLTYYHNPTKPLKLSRMSMYSAYRNYPNFEKSDQLRKLCGVLDWRWNV